ncbi:MAG: hypothetical protein RLZZ562_2446 [Planctomycetota bacterium]
MNRPRTLLLPLLLSTALPSALAQTRRVMPTPQEFVTTQDDSLFSLTRSQDSVHEWEQAREELAQGSHQAAVERLHRVLLAENGGTVAIGPNRFLGLRSALVMEMANLPPAARAAYEELMRREAGALRDKDLAQLRAEQLRMLAERFPASKQGMAARLRLGDLALERGDGHEAAVHFSHAVEASAFGSDEERAAFSRLSCAEALARSGSLRNRSGLSEAEQAALRALPTSQDAADWNGIGGGGDGARLMAEPAGSPKSTFADSVQATNFDYGSGASFAMHATGGLDAIYVNTGMELLAFDPLRGQLVWGSQSPLRETSDGRGLREYANSVNPNLSLSAAVGDDVVIASLQVPDQTTSVRYQGAFTIMKRIPERRLFAFHRATGKLLWSHFDSLGGPIEQRYRSHATCGAPLVIGDTVYAPVHDRSGAIAFYVGAYDVRTGQPRWRRLVCSSQQEVNMFGNASQEFAASPLCERDGLLFGASNLGVCYALERDTGRIRWITSYDVVPMPPTQIQGQDPRPVFFHNSPPSVSSGVVAFTPLDSEFALGIDALTGELLWRIAHEAKANGPNDVRWLCGALGDEFVFSGAGVVAVKARPSAPLERPAAIRQVCPRDALFDDQDEFPRPALTEGRIWIPRQDSVRVVNPDGSRAQDAPQLTFAAPGNLLLVDGIAISLRNGAFEALADVAALRERSRKIMEASPDDPAAILRMCTLTAASGAGSEFEIEALCRRGVAASVAQGLPKEHPLHATFLRRLFDATIARAEQKRGADSLALLIDAREIAPDQTAFLRAQSLVLERSANDADALRRELSTLLQRGRGASYALPEALGPVDVDVYVAWRLARLCTDPAERLAAWQDLLMRHGKSALLRRTVGEVAHAEIAGILEANGRAAYASIEKAAAERLAAAGSDARALRVVCESYPHSDAARIAEQRLLDAAVESGDLATAIDVWSRNSRGEARHPGTVRRAAEAARIRGNLAFAHALMATLQGDTTASDWPSDNGKSYAEIAAAFAKAAAPESSSLRMSLPAAIVREMDNPAPPAQMRALPMRVVDGFSPPIPPMIYIGIEDQVRGLDLGDPALPTRFVHRTGGVERMWLCGGVLVVPSLERIDAIDARTGAAIWSLRQDETLHVCHGVLSGVLLVTQRRNDDRVTLSGIEPLTGREVFTRDFSGADYAPQPRPTATDLLLTRTQEGGPTTLLRIDPLTGRTTAAIGLGAELQQAAKAPPEVIQSPLLLQRFFGDAERVYVPLDGALRGDGAPALIAIAMDGSVAWQWTGKQGQSLAMEALRDGRIAVVAGGSPARGGRPAALGEAFVLDAKTGEQVRTIGLGNDIQVLNWRRLRTDAPAPDRLLLSDLDPDSGDRRLVCLPLVDGEEPFQTPAGSSSEDVLRTPWIRDGLLVYATQSRRSTGPVRLYALRTADRSSALPGGKTSLVVAATPRSAHELATAEAYTVLVTDSRLFLFGAGEEPK